MKIDKLHIRSRFKNLEDVMVDFDEDNLMTVIVGQNGSGKSNVLEAIVAIFRNLDLGEPPPFSYWLVYTLGKGDDSKKIIIDADPCRGSLSKQYQISWSRNIKTNSSIYGALMSELHSVPISKVKRDKTTGESDYLPKHLFSYYSGPSNRLESYFETHRTTFYRKMLKSEVDLKADIRPLFYAQPYHSQFVLLAFFLNDENKEERAFLNKHLGIVGLDSVHFVMRKPGWAKSRNKAELFWGADGVVRDFLDTLYPHALAPIKVTRKENLSLTGNNVSNEFFHLFLKDLETLRAFARGLDPAVFFKMLESTLLSEIISEVNIRVKVESSDTPLTFRELSEGEQQLLTVLGLLKFTGEKDTLFLLDEPDTHLNPAWAKKYLSFLRGFVPDHETSHLLMVTHHPLSIAELEKEQVQVMWNDGEFKVHAQEPERSPRGLGYSGILTSDMFGLRTSLDDPTERLLRLRRRLSEMDELTETQKKRLKKLNEAIEELGFTTSHWDHDYAEYLRLRKQESKELFEEEVDPDVLQQRKDKASEIIRRILEREHTEIDA